MILVGLCVFNFIHNSIHTNLFSVFDCHSHTVTLDNLPFCHEVVRISLNLARGEQLLHKLKTCRTGVL